MGTPGIRNRIQVSASALFSSRKARILKRRLADRRSWKASMAACPSRLTRLQMMKEAAAAPASRISPPKKPPYSAPDTICIGPPGMKARSTCTTWMQKTMRTPKNRLPSKNASIAAAGSSEVKIV